MHKLIDATSPPPQWGRCLNSVITADEKRPNKVYNMTRSKDNLAKSFKTKHMSLLEE